MQPPITPLQLGDIFDRLFKLIGKTAVRNLILSLVILLPASLILSYGMEHFFSSISKLSELKESGDFRGEGIWYLFSSMGTFFFTLLIFMVATFAATLGIIRVSCSAMSGQDLSWREALSQTFSIRLLRIFGQLILQYLIVGIVFVIPYAVLVAGIAGGSMGIAAGGGLVFFASALLSAYLWVRWVFAMTTIAWEDAGVFESFSRSSFLVQGFWWRTFGILILLNIITQFAISIISTPVSFIAFSDFFRIYFDLITSVSRGGEMTPEIMPELMSSFSGTKFVLYIAFASILSLLITPLITVVMYFDLRARKGEFGEISEGDESELATD